MKTKVAFTLSILLMVGMFSIDLVAGITAQQNLLESQISKANLIVYLLQDKLNAALLDSVTKGRDSLLLSGTLQKLLAEEGFACAMVLYPPDVSVYYDDQNCNLRGHLYRMTRKAIASAERSIHFQGNSWGLFWKAKRNLIISAPLSGPDFEQAGISVVMQSEGVYKMLRRTQKMILLYILANAAVLSVIGLYRISRLAVKPIQRMVRRTEEYMEDDRLLFLLEGEDNEFRRLSKSLNRMLERISDDREKLRGTVRSLEATNSCLKKAQNDIILAEKLSSVGRLSAGIAHEIGNPIGIVIGYLDLLRSGELAEHEKNDYIERAETEINRINKIIRQLLDFARPSQKNETVVSVHGIINDLSEVSIIQPLMANIRIRRCLSAENDRVAADPEQLRQVFLNLMINAADAILTSHNALIGELVISTENSRHDDGLVPGCPPALIIRFSDNGPGISGEELKIIFDPFYTTKEPGKGTGLGLSVCYMIVDGLKGNIKADSAVGRGTSFTVTLPLSQLE